MRPPYGLLLCFAASLSLTLGVPAGNAKRGAGCGPAGYGYVGVASATAVYGVGARLVALSPPSVENGHVAAWVGVSDVGVSSGPPEWIQIGLAAFAEGRRDLYYEVALPGRRPRYVRLGAAETGQPYRISVRELAGRHGFWQARLDGRPVGLPVHLPGSSGRWAGVATAESWRSASACNAFRFRFEHVSVAQAPGARWTGLPLGRRYQGPGLRFVLEGNGFLAAAE